MANLNADNKSEKKAKKAKASNASKQVSSKLSQIQEYFRSHELDPKIARAKLRRAGYNAPYSMANVKKVFGK